MSLAPNLISVLSTAKQRSLKQSSAVNCIMNGILFEAASAVAPMSHYAILLQTSLFLCVERNTNRF